MKIISLDSPYLVESSIDDSMISISYELYSWFTPSGNKPVLKQIRRSFWDYENDQYLEDQSIEPYSILIFKDHNNNSVKIIVGKSKAYISEL